MRKDLFILYIATFLITIITAFNYVLTTKIDKAYNYLNSNEPMRVIALLKHNNDPNSLKIKLDAYYLNNDTSNYLSTLIEITNKNIEIKEDEIKKQILDLPPYENISNDYLKLTKIFNDYNFSEEIIDKLTEDFYWYDAKNLVSILSKDNYAFKSLLVYYNFSLNDSIGRIGNYLFNNYEIYNINEQKAIKNQQLGYQYKNYAFSEDYLYIYSKDPTNITDSKALQINIRNGKISELKSKYIDEVINEFRNLNLHPYNNYLYYAKDDGLYKINYSLDKPIKINDEPLTFIGSYNNQIIYRNISNQKTSDILGYMNYDYFLFNINNNELNKWYTTDENKTNFFHTIKEFKSKLVGFGNQYIISYDNEQFENQKILNRSNNGLIYDISYNEPYYYFIDLSSISTLDTNENALTVLQTIDHNQYDLGLAVIGNYVVRYEQNPINNNINVEYIKLY